MSQALDALLRYAELSYFRLEAEQLIADCLDRRDAAPFEGLLEELVLAGTASLGVMREILDVIYAMKSDLSRRGLDVRQDLAEAMAEFGILLPEVLSTKAPAAFLQIASLALREQVEREAYQLDPADRSLAIELCAEAGKKVTMIARQLAILQRLESSVSDWIVGLAYHAAHEGQLASADPLKL